MDTCAGDDTPQGLRQAELRVLGRYNDVASQGLLESAAVGDAVDGGDNRLVQGVKGVVHPAPFQEALVVRGALLQVAAGGERPCLLCR